VLTRSIVGFAVVLAIGSPKLAQPALAQSARPGAPEDTVKARSNIFMMEAVLEQAVEQGAMNLREKVRRVMPDMLTLSGAAQARGFRLDGYGVFFDVEVPSLRHSVAWSLRTMADENGMGAARALQLLKAYVQKLQDPGARQNLEQAIKRIELQVGPTPAPTDRQPIASAPSDRGTMSAAVADQDPPVLSSIPSPPSAPPPIDETLLDDPNEAYTAAVKSALVDAMLDFSSTLRVGADEWLTIAARDNEHRDRLVPMDPYDTSTILLRIKGSDLAAFRAERITREEALKRVEVREF
jgi:hypothetical protein